MLATVEERPPPLFSFGTLQLLNPSKNTFFKNKLVKKLLKDAQTGGLQGNKVHK